MIVLRTKQFIAPLLGAAVRALGGKVMTGTMIAGTGISAYQGHQQGKEMEKQGEVNREAAEKQAELLKEQNRELSKIAERAKTNPSAAGEVTSILSNKNYSIISTGSKLLNKFSNTNTGKFTKSIGNAAKDAFGKSALDNVKMGAAVAGTTYPGGKYIQHDLKKNKLDIDSNGSLIPKSYSISPMKVLNAVKRNSGTVALGSAMGGVPLVLEYTADKKQIKDQINSTTNSPSLEQKQFGIIPGLGKLTSGWKTLKSHPMQSITGGVSKFTSFGIGGTENIQKFGTKAKEYGTKNGSNLAVKAGDWISKHKTAANAISIVPGLGAAKLTWDGVTNAGDKIGKTLDPKAYKYKESKDKIVDK